jgi:hypothetical protein
MLDKRTQQSFGSVGAVHMPLQVDIDLSGDVFDHGINSSSFIKLLQLSGTISLRYPKFVNVNTNGDFPVIGGFCIMDID